MNLRQQLAHVEQLPKGPRCQVCRVVSHLDGEDLTALLAAFASESYTHDMITRALQADGHDVMLGSVSRHRRGLCRGTVGNA